MILNGCNNGGLAGRHSNVNFESSVQPETGSGEAAVLTVRFSAPAGQTIREARVLANTYMDGRNGCYVYHERAENLFLLIDDSGMQARRAAPGATIIENSQCVLDLARSSSQPGESSLTLTLALRFKSAFAGKKQLFLYAETSELNSGLVARGSWDATFSGPTVR
jgi:hypothetical protein